MSGPARVLLLTDAAMQLHLVEGHPERPQRLAAVAAGVEQGADAAHALLERRAPRAAPDSILARVHDPRYLAALEAVAGAGGGWLDDDTYLGPGSLRAARLAAGGALDAALTVARGEAEVAFAVVRPPGHHAFAQQASGFCLLNNVAVAVAALRAEGLAQRIAIVDFDVHHGDGTQAIFDGDGDLCYASTHQSPLFPGTGSPAERGSGPARGTKHNVPLSAGSGDVAFIAAWREQLLPAVEAFAPQAILVSAGYDAHRDDPLANLQVTQRGYRQVAHALGEMARRGGVGGVALTLEGGYDLEALTACAAATVEGLIAGLGSPSV